MKPRSSHTKITKCAIRAMAAGALLLGGGYAQAWDGCRVILCLAGPWRSIPACVPDVTAALKCMARGKCWPTCPSAPGVSLGQVSGAACPPQYGIYEYDTWGNATLTGCTKTGVIDVAMPGSPSWARVWFNPGAADNAVVMQYSSEAKRTLGEYASPQFDIDYELWLASRPPVINPCAAPGSDQCGNQ